MIALVKYLEERVYLEEVGGCGRAWWGEAPEWSQGVREAMDVLLPRRLLVQ